MGHIQVFNFNGAKLHHYLLDKFELFLLADKIYLKENRFGLVGLLTEDYC